MENWSDFADWKGRMTMGRTDRIGRSSPEGSLIAPLLVAVLAIAVGATVVRAQVPDLPPPPPDLSSITSGMGSVGSPGAGVVSGGSILPAPLPPETAEVDAFLDDLIGDGAFRVVAGHGRLLTVGLDLIGPEGQEASIAIGDPETIEAEVVGPRQVRVTGKRFGATDLAITSPGGEVANFEVLVTANLDLLEAQLMHLFPDASIRLEQVYDHVVVAGQARDSVQVARIIETVRAYVESIPDRHRAEPVPPLELLLDINTPPTDLPKNPIPAPADSIPLALLPLTDVLDELRVEGSTADLRVINLIRVPGPQQVLLKVRIAELNREALREIGANLLGVNPDTGNIFGTKTGTRTSQRGGAVGPGNVSGVGEIMGMGLLGEATGATNDATTVFGIFESADFEILLRALRRNSVLKILAEPNLVALNGHLASFLAGGEFPIPVPQVTGGAAAAITVAFKEFGVRLGFVPYILDGDTIRLTVAPEVSDIDFSFATTLVQNGQPIPGLTSRKSQTTVELREGQTLAIAGLLQLRLDAETSRIPGLGDLPVLGPFFSNTSNQRQEKELIVLVTPYLIRPMDPDQVPPTPGDLVDEPNDLEFYLLNRIEGKTGVDWRSTTKWDDPFDLVELLNLESAYLQGPVGFSE